MRDDCMEGFLPVVRDWFLENTGEPSEPQKRGWPEIAAGKNVLICAPTGSGKTFAAFLKCLDMLYSRKKPGEGSSGVKIVYISPLKALNNDIYRNLEIPLKGIRRKAEEQGLDLPVIETAVRTGDTPQKERSRMLRYPPDILITTPESLFIMLTSPSSRNLFTEVEYIIVDEIHSICANKRGVHLSVSVERLERLAGKPLKRIGLTATVNPLEEAAYFLAGRRPDSSGASADNPREISILDCSRKRAFELSVRLPVDDLRALPDNTIWPAIYTQLMELIRAHKSTLVFVNNRRAAELVAAGLNRLAEEPFVRTHHGSVSKEIRHELETQLKEGLINCLVATSSLELGIDIGSIELVVQISAPGSPAQVLQRIGRSGHRLDAVSKGIIIPKTRGDLLNSAFISYQAKQYKIEDIRVPQNCLDILAQQLASIAAEGEQDAGEVLRLIRCAYPYRDLPEKQFSSVLAMLTDPSPEDAPGTMKPRLTYDRLNGKIRGTALGSRMCLTSGGTIPDKGNYAVYLMDTEIKLGELQEEFVFESRLGERFFLGSSVWRLEKVEKDRVLVSPSTDSGAKIPFWMGDQVLRTYETGAALGAFLKRLEAACRGKGGFRDIAASECGLDETAAENLRQYVSDQIAATGRLPGDNLIVCEHFSDETGDRRMIVHSAFGGRIHAPLSVLLHAKLTRLLNCRIEYVYNDDGILLHFTGYTGKLSNVFSLLTADSFEDEVFELLPAAPLFNINLRYNLARALLIEPRGFGKRTPLWIQRLRAAEVAQSVLSGPDHPAVVETYRECMNDIFDIGSLYKLMENIRAGRVGVLDVYTEKPSPFSSELLFNFWQVFQYAYDLPVAERRNQLLVNDRDFIQLAAGVDAEYELMDPRAVEAIQKELEAFKYDRKIASADELHHHIHSFGRLPCENRPGALFKEVGAEALAGYLDLLMDQKRIMRVTSGKAGTEYWIAAEDYTLYEIAAGKSAVPPDVAAEAAVRILRRFVLYTGPFSPSDILEKYDMSDEILASALERLLTSDELVRLRRAADGREAVFCHRKVYERIKRRTVALARGDIKPKAPEVYCSFLFKLHLLGGDVLPPDEKLTAVVGILQGVFLPVSWWEEFIFPARIRKYEPKLLDYLCSTGVIRWSARTSGSTREVSFRLAQEAEESGDTPEPAEITEFTADEYEARILNALADRGASFLKELSKQAGLPAGELLAKLERLVWSGVVTNDSFSVARYYTELDRKNSPWAKYNTYPSMGRWYMAERRTVPRNEKGLSEYVNRILDRYGVISKEIAALDAGVFKWSEIYAFLKAGEFSSGIKRGFYISGLSGIQFARDRELEQIRLQDSPEAAESYAALCSMDPANPYKDLFVKKGAPRLPKGQGTALVFRNGLPVLAVKDFGSTLQPLVQDPKVLEKAAQCFVDSFNSRSLWTSRKNLFTEYWEEPGAGGGGILDSPLYEKLLEMGYDRGYNGISLWRRSV